MKFLKFLIPLLFVPAMLGATAIEYTVVADTTAIYPSKGERGVKVLNGEFKMYRSTGDISLDFHVNEGSVAIASQLTVPAVIISTFTMDVGATVDYVLTTDANGVGTWQATVTGVTDHAALTSTGTLTHVQLETSLDNIGIATGTLSAQLDQVAIDTTTLAGDITALEAVDTQIAIDTTTLQTNIGLEESARIAADSAIGIATGTIRTDFEAADAAIGVATGTLRTDLDNVIISTGQLQTDLSQEVLDRIAGDTAIGIATGTITGRLDDLDVSTATLQDNIDLKVAKAGDTMTGTLITNAGINTSTFTMNTGVTNGYVLTTDANGVGTWKLSAGGVTDHTQLTSTGTLTHVELESSLTDIGTATGTLRTDVDAVIISTGQLQTDLNTEINDRETADLAIGVATGTLRTDLTAVQVSTGVIQLELDALKVAVANDTDTLRTDLIAVQVSTGINASRIDALDIATGTLTTEKVAIAGDTMTGTLNGTDIEITYGLKTATFTMTTGATDGYILQSDASGNATWISSNSFEWKELDIDTTTLVAGDLLRYDGTDIVRIASGTSAGSYLQQDFTWATPSGAGDVTEAGDNDFTGTNTHAGLETFDDIATSDDSLYKLIYSTYNVTTALITITGLLGDTDKEYFIVLAGTVPTAADSINITFNADATDNNYASRRSLFAGAYSANAGNNRNCILMGTLFSQANMWITARSGSERTLNTQCFYSDTANTVTGNSAYGVSWENTADEITRIDLSPQTRPTMYIHYFAVYSRR